MAKKTAVSAQDDFIRDLNRISARPATDLSYRNLLFLEAMKSAFDRIDPVALAKFDTQELDNFKHHYKKSIVRIVRYTLEAQIENE